MAVNPFDYVKAINEKNDVEDPSQYNPYIGNLAFSQSMDSVLLANEMNINHGLPPEAQYAFLHGALTKRKRWGKWYKAEEHPHLQLIMDYYKYSKEKALEALQVLTQENIRDIIDSMNKGGK